MATTTNNGWETPDDTDLVKDGALAMRTLGNAIDTSVGTGLLAWTSYTPTMTNITVGNGTLAAAYVQLGKTVHVRFKFILGSTSSIGSTGSKTVSLPSTPKSIYAGLDVIGTSSAIYPGTYPLVPLVNGSTVILAAQNVTGTYIGLQDISNTVPFSWVAGNTLTFNIVYEVN